MRILVFLAAAGCLPAQEPPRLGAGVQFAVPFTGTFLSVGGREFASDASAGWMIGPAIHWRFADRVGLAFSALYRRVGRDAGGGYIGFSDRERGYSWELPLLARFRISQRGVRPFVTAGPGALLVHTHTDSETVLPVSGFLERVALHSIDTDATGGVIAGGGVEHRYRRALLTFEVRYTRWLTGTCYAQELRCLSKNRGLAVFEVGL